MLKDIESEVFAATKAKIMHMAHDVAGERTDRIILEYQNRSTFQQVFQTCDKVTVTIADKMYEMFRVMVSD